MTVYNRGRMSRWRWRIRKKRSGEAYIGRSRWSRRRRKKRSRWLRGGRRGVGGGEEEEEEAK